MRGWGDSKRGKEEGKERRRKEGKEMGRGGRPVPPQTFFSGAGTGPIAYYEQ